MDSRVLKTHIQLFSRVLSLNCWVICWKDPLLSVPLVLRVRAAPPPAGSIQASPFALMLRALVWLLGLDGSHLSWLFIIPQCREIYNTVVVRKSTLSAPRPGECTQLFYFWSLSLFSSRKSLIPVYVLGILPWTCCSSPTPSPQIAYSNIHPERSAQRRKYVAWWGEDPCVVLTGLQTWAWLRLYFWNLGTWALSVVQRSHPHSHQPLCTKTPYFL